MATEAEIQQSLDSLRAAYHKLIAGEKLAEGRGTDGRAARYHLADIPRLEKEIARLENELALLQGAPTRAPIYPAMNNFE